MKIKNIFNFMVLFVAALSIQSCSDSDNKAAATALTITQDDVEIESLDFQIGENTVMLGVNTDGEWTVSIPAEDESWLGVTPHAGYGWDINDAGASNYRSYFKVTVQKNNSEARSSAITVKAGSMTKVIAVNQKGDSTDPNDPFESAWSMVENFRMGYNMGNNLESNPYGTWFNGKEPKDWETAWGQPEISTEIIDALVEKGFNVIRVPVTWYPHIPGFAQGDYTIDAAWMNRVKEVVKMVTDAGCYCIVNIQHDAGANNGSGDPHSAWLHADDDYETVTVIYKAIWKQIAEEFKNESEKVIFEPFNEILDKGSSWTAPAAGHVAYETIAKLQQDFVNVVRATGGNNEYRNLLFTTYGDTGNNDDAVNALTVPEDIHSNHLCATFHSYDPYWFCNDGSTDDEKNFYINYFTADEQAVIDAIFIRVDKKCSALGVPYFFGEFGAIGSHPDMVERVKYTDYVTNKFNQYKTAGLWWNGLLNRKTLEWTESDIVDAFAKNRK